MQSEFETAVTEVSSAASKSRRAWTEMSNRASVIRSNCLSAFNKNRSQAERAADRSLLRASERARVSAEVFIGLCQGANSQASETESRSELALDAMRSGSSDHAALARITMHLDQWHACLRDEESGGSTVSGRHAPGLAPRTFRDANSLKASCSPTKPTVITSEQITTDPLIQALNDDHLVVCSWLSNSPAHDPIFSELVRLESAIYELISVLEHEVGLREVLAAMETINIDPEIKPFTGILDMEILRLRHYLGMEISETGTEEE